MKEGESVPYIRAVRSAEFACSGTGEKETTSANPRESQDQAERSEDNLSTIARRLEEGKALEVEEIEAWRSNVQGEIERIREEKSSPTRIELPEAEKTSVIRNFRRKILRKRNNDLKKTGT